MASGTVNKVILIGRLGADPEVRYSANGMAVANFNMATNERVPAGEGNWEDRPEWHRIVAFGKLAEICGNYLSKGRLVFVEGRLQTEQWEDAQGIKRYTTKIVARDVQFLGGVGERTSQTQSPQAEMRNSGGSSSAEGDRSFSDQLPPAPDTPPEEDIPF